MANTVYTQDGKWSWFVCLSATLSWFAAMGFVFSFGIFFPVFMDYFQESREKTGTSCVFSASLVVINKYFKERLSLATGIMMLGQGGGVLILGPLLQTMIDAYGWRTTYRIMAGVVPALCLFGLTYSPNIQSKEQGKEAVIEENKKGCHIDVSVWKEPEFVAVCVSASIIMFGHYVPQIHLVRYCEDIGITADAASQLFIYYGVASCVGRLVTGRLCDFENVNTTYVYQLAEIVVGTGTLIITLATSYLHMVIYIVIYGLCDGVFITSLNVLLLTCLEKQGKTPVVIGWEMQVSSFFLASGPPIAGLMADSTNSYTHAFYMAGTVVLAGAFIPFMLLYTKRRDPRVVNNIYWL